MILGFVLNSASIRALLQSSGNRLRLALVGAVCVHLALMVAAHWGINLNAIPSEYHRVLTLTLENTASEGHHDETEIDSATRNDVLLADAKDVMPQPERGELIAADELNPDGELLPNPESTERGEVQDEVAELSAQSRASPKGRENAAELVSTSIESRDHNDANRSPLLSDLPFLTAEFGMLAVSSEQGAPELKVAESISVTESEQRMLDQKIKHWAETIQDMEDLSQSLTWQEQGQTFVASFSHVPAAGEMDLDEVVVEVRTEKDGEQLTTKMRMKKLAFSNFGQFVHRWDPAISMHDDEMTGRFHSNTRFNLEYTQRAKPTFSDKVTTASYRVNLNGPTSKQNIFRGGLETGVKRIAMPKPRMLFPESESGELSEDRENTIFIDSASRLTFLKQGSVLIQSLKDAAPMRKIELGDSPVYLIAGPKAAVHVSGVVNGIVAVYSPKRIVIEGDIVYQSFDDVNQGGDFLGLVSGRSVVIPSRKVTGPGDLTIHAAIYAKNRFSVTYREGRRDGTLNVVGSVSAGTLSATEPRYATKIEFDRRFENVRPPGFPVTDRYEVAAAANGWVREQSTESQQALMLEEDSLDGVNVDENSASADEDLVPAFIRQ